MARFSNKLLTILNLLLLLLSIGILFSGSSLGLRRRAATECEKFLHRPVVLLGAFLLVVSVAGLVGACSSYVNAGASCLLWLYLLVLFLLWLQKRVEDGENWGKIKSCMQEGKVCHRGSHLSLIQSGCCKPPIACNFTYQNPTVWIKPAGFNSSTFNRDCKTWSNDQNALCFECQSCKAGVVATLKNEWKKFAVANVILLIFLIVVYSADSFASKNKRPIILIRGGNEDKEWIIRLG
ncbi:tetraspanin-8-like [Typha latifolia]|uniref:tetraspanin-8-like n=1 Tax=Typha latifolia TaxID=4733 RepID=UPI003C2B395F